MKIIEIMKLNKRIKEAKEDLKRVEARYAETKEAADGCYIYSLQSYIINCYRILGELKGWSFEKTSDLISDELGLPKYVRREA